MKMPTLTNRQLLHHIGKSYVINGLGAKNFDAIPYDNAVVLRAPLCPGGSMNPLFGKETIRNIWWAPLPSLVGKVEFINSYVNEENTAVAVEFHCEIIEPSCLLRIIDRFTVNKEGYIIQQENFFDPRDVVQPGWRG